MSKLLSISTVLHNASINKLGFSFNDDALKSFEGSVVSFYFTGEIKPSVLKEEGNKELVQLLLPVRVF